MKTQTIKRNDEFITSTNWQDTRVYDKNQNDLTEGNIGFIGLAKYERIRNFVTNWV